MYTKIEPKYAQYNLHNLQSMKTSDEFTALLGEAFGIDK